MSRDVVAAIDNQNAILRFLSLPDAVLQFHYHGKTVKLFIPDADGDLIQNEILRTRCFFEIGPLEACHGRFKLKGANVLDIGAYIGNHAVFFGLICEVAKCTSFEPNPYAAEILRTNVRLNGLGDRVECHEVGVSSRAGRLGYDRHQSRNLGGTSFTASDDGPIAAISVDELKLPHLDFVKIDVEGMASAVIEGARETLSQHKPPLFVEMWGAEFTQTDELLRRLGYRQTANLGVDNYFYEATA